MQRRLPLPLLHTNIHYLLPYLEIKTARDAIVIGSLPRHEETRHFLAFHRFEVQLGEAQSPRSYKLILSFMWACPSRWMDRE